MAAAVFPTPSDLLLCSSSCCVTVCCSWHSFWCPATWRAPSPPSRDVTASPVRSRGCWLLLMRFAGKAQQYSERLTRGVFTVTLLFHVQVGNTVLIIFVSFFGSRVHRPRFIGGGALLACLASLLIALPHFLSGPYEYTDHISRERKHTEIEYLNLMGVIVHYNGAWGCCAAASHQGLLFLCFSLDKIKAFVPENVSVFPNSLRQQPNCRLPVREQPQHQTYQSDLQPAGQPRPARSVPSAAAGAAPARNWCRSHPAFWHLLHWRSCQQEELTSLSRYNRQERIRLYFKNGWRIIEAMIVFIILE